MSFSLRALLPPFRRVGMAVLLTVSVSTATGCLAPQRSDFPALDLIDQPFIVFSAVVDERDELRSPVTLGGESRPVLVAPTPAEFRYRLSLPAAPRLTFSLAIVDAPGVVRTDARSEEKMRFTLRAGKRQPDTVLFEKDVQVAGRGDWMAQQVDLSRFAGDEVWLSFQTSLVGFEQNDSGDSGAVAPYLGLFADPILHDVPRYRDGRGVVLISVESLRRDHLSSYGYPRDTTPGLEILARDSVVFDDAVSASSATLPAHASMLTSAYPGAHGAVTPSQGLSPSLPSLATTLREHGYYTQAVVSHPYLSRAYGFDNGFDRHRYLPDTQAEQVTDAAVEFLDARGDRDFFLLLHYNDPHWSYDPPPAYAGTFDPGYSGRPNVVGRNGSKSSSESISEQNAKHIEALYDGEALYVDRQMERLFREMKRLNLFDKTLIAVTSDHGEELLDHGSWGHGTTLYEEQLRIPLLLKLPGNVEAGRRLGGQVSSLDLAPTILDAIGLGSPASFQGRSLLPLLSGKTIELVDVWSEIEDPSDGSRKIAVRRGRDGPKAIFELPVSEAGQAELRGELAYELFDLSADPKEQKPLTGEPASFERDLARYLERIAIWREGRPSPPAVEPTPKELESLRLLGDVP